MAKKYHLTPNGPGVCTAKEGRCPYAQADHFETTTPLYATDLHNFKIKRAQEKYDEIKRKYVGAATYSRSIQETINKNNDYGNRDVALKIQSKKDEQVDFININREFSFYMDSDFEEDPKKQVTVNLERYYRASDKAQEVRVLWKITINHPRNKLNPKQEINFDLLDRNVVENNKIKINEIAWLAASKNFHDEELISKNQDYLNQKIWDTIISIESENRSEVQAKKMGLSLFEDSDPLRIKANNHYDSTFRPGHLRRRLTTAPFLGNEPDVKIRVYDNEPKYSNNWWAIKREGESFIVTTYTEKDGKIEANIKDPSEARRIVEDFNNNEMRASSAERSKEKGLFAENFVREVSDILEKHKNSLSSDSSERTKNKSDDELFDRSEEEDKGTILGRIFKILN